MCPSIGFRLRALVVFVLVMLPLSLSSLNGARSAEFSPGHLQTTRGSVSYAALAPPCPPTQPPPTSDTRCYASLPGCLDSTFGAGLGYLHTDPDGLNYTNQANGVDVQPDGKVVVAGTTRTSASNIDFAVIRYNVDGSLDTSFGDPDPFNPLLRRGIAVTSFSNGIGDYARSVLAQPDGKIIVAGFGMNSTLVAARYNANGTLDAGFGTGGKVIVNGYAAYDIVLQSDGKIVLGGYSGTAFGVVRLNANGSLDSSFASGGKLAIKPPGTTNANGWSVAIQRIPAVTGEERIVLAGWSKTSSTAIQSWTLMRLKPNGTKDTTFGTSGTVKTAFFGFGEQARRLRIDAANRIVVAGHTQTAGSNCAWVSDFAVARYNQDGGLDASFGGGKQVIDIFGLADSLYGLAVQGDGKILIGGSSGSNSVQHFSLARLNVDGSRDTSFGLLGNGVLYVDLYGLRSYGFALATNSTDGKIVVAGGTYFALGQPGDIGVARFLNAPASMP